MINKIIGLLRRPPITVRVSPHTQKLEVVRVIYLDTYDPGKHRDDTDYDPKQVGDLSGDPELGGDE